MPAESIYADPPADPDVRATDLDGVNVPDVFALPDFHVYTIVPAPPDTWHVPPAAATFTGETDNDPIEYVVDVIQSPFCTTVSVALTPRFFVTAVITADRCKPVFDEIVAVTVAAPFDPDITSSAHHDWFDDIVQSVFDVTVNVSSSAAASGVYDVRDNDIDGSTPPPDSSLCLLFNAISRLFVFVFRQGITRLDIYRIPAVIRIV